MITSSNSIKTERCLTVKEVAQLANVSVSWVWQMARAGKAPRPIKISPRCTRWRLSDIESWLSGPQGWQKENEGA